MPSILVVEKTGVIKEVSLKSFSQEELYKKAGFKNADDFKSVHSWTMEIDGKSTTISLYGKTSGRAGQENKYDFPPPVDTILFFGSCILVANVSPDGKTCDDLNTDRWEAIYEALFCGFEDIGDESEESEDDVDSDVPRTKDGYVKDGFVVDEDNDDDDYESDEDDYETEEDEPQPKVNKSKPAKQPKTPAKKKNTTVFDKIDTMVSPEDMNTFLDCSSELVEEEYE
jgi:hypothetical protein